MKLIIKRKNIPACLMACIACLFVGGLMVVSLGQPLMDLSPSESFNMIIAFSMIAISCLIGSIGCAILNREQQDSPTPSIQLRATPEHSVTSPIPTLIYPASPNLALSREDITKPGSTASLTSLASLASTPIPPATVVAIISIAPEVPELPQGEPEPGSPSESRSQFSIINSPSSQKRGSEEDELAYTFQIVTPPSNH